MNLLFPQTTDEKEQHHLETPSQSDLNNSVFTTEDSLVHEEFISSVEQDQSFNERPEGELTLSVIHRELDGIISLLILSYLFYETEIDNNPYQYTVVSHSLESQNWGTCVVNYFSSALKEVLSCQRT